MTFDIIELKEVVKIHCTIIHRYPIFSTRYSVVCKVYTGYHGPSEKEHGLCVCTVDGRLSPRLSSGIITVQTHKLCSISHMYWPGLHSFFRFWFIFILSTENQKRNAPYLLFFKKVPPTFCQFYECFEC